jgi:creatinine amidohydrolase
MTTVRWTELKPEEFEARLSERPLVYLPMGMCEPHGHAAAFGLDLLKAEDICDQAAERFGGIVAPSQGYHIHEVGYHAPWLDEVIGTTNPRMAALPPDVVLRSLLFQLRAFVNAGFRSIAVITGHNGAQADLRMVADEFMKIVPVPVTVRSDPELVAGTFPGDHAGKFEISQLLYLRPELVDMSRLGRTATDPLGRFAQGPDAHQATPEYGRQIIDAMVDAVGALITAAGNGLSDLPPLSMEAVEPAWDAINARRTDWVSYGPVSG